MTDEDPAGLGRLAARGALLTGTTQFIRFGLQLLSLAVLARLLSPFEFGVAAMVTAAIGVADVFRDLGLSTAAIQARNLRQEEQRNLFYVNSGTGLLLSLAAYVLAPAVAAFFGEPATADVTRALAILFLINGVAAQARADLSRRLEFRRLAIVDVTAQMIGVTVAIVTAISEAGYWALVYSQLSYALVAAVLTFRSSNLKLGRYERDASISSHLRFGSPLMLTQIVGYLSRNVDTLAVGVKFGTIATGFYSRAFQVVWLPLTQISAPATNVALPVLSRVRDDPVRYGRYLLSAQAVLTYGLVGTIGLAFVSADVVVAVALGSEWLPIVSLVRIFCVGAALQVAAYPTYWVFLSLGMTASNLWFSLVSRSLLLVAVMFGSLFSPEGVAVGYVAGLAVIWPFGLWWIRRKSIVAVLSLFSASGRPLTMFGTGSVLGCIAQQVTGGFEPSVRAACAGILGFAGGTGLVLLVRPAMRNDVQRVFQAASLLRRVPESEAGSGTRSIGVSS